MNGRTLKLTPRGSLGRRDSVNQRRTLVLRLNNADDAPLLPFFYDADGRNAGSDGGAGDNNFSVIHDAGVSVSADIMRGNAGFNL